MQSVAQGITWAKSPAAERRNGKSWAGWCQSFAFRFSGANRSAETAYLAFKGSGPVQSKDPSKAPKGAFHWWSDGGAGHVAVSIGDGNAAMASAAVDHRWGDDQGYIAVSKYNAEKPGLKYLGWTFDMLGYMMSDIVAYIRIETAKEKAAADKAKAEKAAAAKAAAEKAAAAKAAAEKAKAEQAANEKALADQAAAATPIPEANVYFPLVKEAGHPEVYLLEGPTKVHVTHEQWLVYKALGVSGWTEVPAGALSAFRTVT